MPFDKKPGWENNFKLRIAVLDISKFGEMKYL
jgi:hypothetical protein